MTTQDDTPFMGILMLDTAFPRPVGDIGNPDTFDFPARKEIVSGAHPDRIVLEDAAHWLPAFTDAARGLERQGARLITTSCGFLAPFQQAIGAAVNVPVLTSSLHLYRQIAANLETGRRPGILTISPATLGPAHLEAAGIPANAIVGGMPEESHFRRAILQNRTTLDMEQAGREHVAAALAMREAHSDLGAILLECTNMPPHAMAIAEATGLPVFSLNDGLRAVWHGRPLQPACPVTK
ncbi:MAG: aspartate/glutamate racemase family protein [Nitratireductor sp.]|nr:aspartate/glutamate racemase family protein [Nitratireductor sp.]